MALCGMGGAESGATIISVTDFFASETSLNSSTKKLWPFRSIARRMSANKRIPASKSIVRKIGGIRWFPLGRFDGGRDGRFAN